MPPLDLTDTDRAALATCCASRSPPTVDEPALQIICGNCGEETVITLMRLRMLAFVRCGCGHTLLDEDEVHDYRRRLERAAKGD